MVVAASGMRLVSTPQPAAHIMAIEALADPQTLARIAGLFAQFDVVPITLSSQRAGEALLINVKFVAEDGTRIDLLLAKIEAMVVVQRASLVGA